MSRVSSANPHYNTVQPQFQLSSLAALACTLDSRPPILSDRTRRAAVAIILRCHSHQHEHSAKHHQTHKSPLKQNPTNSSTAPDDSDTLSSQHLQHDSDEHQSAALPPPPTSTSSSSATRNTRQRRSKLSTTEEFEQSDMPNPATAETTSPGPQPRSSRRLVKTLTAINRLGITEGFHQSDTQIEILYMLRAHNPRDRWSGQIAFPGGRQSKQDKGSDEATACREVQEEIGLDLYDTTSYVQLGRLDDFHIDPLAKGLKSLSVSVFIYLQLKPQPPVMDSKEVRAIIWTPVSFFVGDEIPWASLRFPVERVTASDKARKKTPNDTSMSGTASSPSVQAGPASVVTPNATAAKQHHTHDTTEPHGLSAFVEDSSATFKSVLPISLFPFSIYFPALSLPGYYLLSDGQTGYSSVRRDSAEAASTGNQVHITAVKGKQKTAASNTANPLSASQASSLDPNHMAGEFILWGFTLRVTAQLCLAMGFARMQSHLSISDRSSRILQRIVQLNSRVQSMSLAANLGSWKWRSRKRGEQQTSNAGSKAKAVIKPTPTSKL